jgi:hypothetical protein
MYYPSRQQNIPDHPLPLAHGIFLTSGFRILISQSDGLVVFVPGGSIETESQDLNHEQCHFVRHRLGFSMSDDNILHLLFGVDGVGPSGFGDSDVRCIGCWEELLDCSWACCAELPAWRCNVLCVDKTWPAGFAGDVGAIEVLEDRGGLPSQDGVGADYSGATHWVDYRSIDGL